MKARHLIYLKNASLCYCYEGLIPSDGNSMSLDLKLQPFSHGLVVAEKRININCLCSGCFAEPIPPAHLASETHQ